MTALRRSRALRFGLITSALVLTVCAALAVVAGTAFTAAAAQLEAARERAFGTIVGVDRNQVLLRWTPAGERERTDTVELAGSPFPVGTRTEVAYDPATPSRPLIPGASVLAAADRSLSTLYLTGIVASSVVAVGGWQILSRRRVTRRPARAVAVRRIRIQNGLTSRSWLEIDTTPQHFVPVHFDPVLIRLPSPTIVRMQGDPLRDRLVGAELNGNFLYASGPVRSTEPRGRRTDNADRPDASTLERAALLGPLTRQLRADLPLVVPAPFIGLLWTYVDRGGLLTWVAVTALAASLGLWLAAMRGSDPS